ncbi:MAG: cytochrome c oxidase assembly protein [Actinomycetota bacterium]|nr:cytochrome c oxidase assembly protein [Actinomycetota bacterium]
MRPSVLELLAGHWQLSAGLLVQATACAALYAWGAIRLGRRWPLRRTASFMAGVAVVLVSLQSGLDSYADRLLSVHMQQHMLLLLVAPALLLGGRPVLLALQALAPSRRTPVARTLARARGLTAPLVCLGVFCAVVGLAHVPALYDAALAHPALHDTEHAAFLAAGLMLWWPILDGDPARRLGALGRLGYLIVAMVPMGIVGAYLNRHVALVYSPYATAARTMGISAATDQADAGAIMWVVGDVIMVAIGLWATIGALVAEERRQQARDARAARMLTPEGQAR